MTSIRSFVRIRPPQQKGLEKFSRRPPRVTDLQRYSCLSCLVYFSVSLRDIHLKRAFRSSKSFDQQVVSRDTMPKAMLEAYLACDKPPPLDKLNPYREDGKDGLKFYTDPTYFFELWRQEMLKDTERMMHDRGKKVRTFIFYLKGVFLANYFSSSTLT